MAKLLGKISIKKSKRKMAPPGSSPGLLQPTEGALAPQITIYSFLGSFFQEIEIRNFDQIKDALQKHPDKVHWVDIKGLGDMTLLESIKNEFGISNLIIEDIIHTHQRPKLEEFDEYLFATSRMLCLNQQRQLENEQISFILTSKILFTFQENYDDCLDPVRNRLREGKGNIRISGPSYLMYALMDLILDNYFYLIHHFGDELDMLEERLYRKPDKTIVFDAQQIKRAFILIRRSAWPERDKINDLLRSSSPLITENTKFFLKDVYDHSMQIIDLVESYKEITNSLIDIYLSFVSNRTNDIMRVLTVISSIFIPLTFIAGVYGMNFAYQNPKTGKILPNNMPELYSDYGYVYVMFAMAFIALVQVVYFWRKGWLK